VVIERLPITEVDAGLRGAVKRVIGFQEPPALDADEAAAAGPASSGDSA
jgi:hypothetical protein